MITGIGGQGVQLAAQVIARAAILDGRNVSTLGIYGGTMRGGNTDSTVIVADGPIEAPPIVSRAWSAIGLHDEYWLPVEQKLRTDAVVLVNDATFTARSPLTRTCTACARRRPPRSSARRSRCRW